MPLDVSQAPRAARLRPGASTTADNGSKKTRFRRDETPPRDFPDDDGYDDPVPMTRRAVFLL